MIARSVAAIVVVTSIGTAQEKPMPKTDRTLQAEETPSAALPSFDLPEFVITGKESIDLPSSEKRSLPDASRDRTIERPGGSGVERTGGDRTDAHTLRASVTEPGLHSGRAYLGIGSFSTVVLGLQASGTVTDVHAQGEAEDASTAGYDPNTDASRFHLNAGVRVPTNILSATIEGERTHVDGEFRRDVYRWYGSATPAIERRVNSGSGTVGLSGYLRGGSLASLSLSYRGGSFADSTATIAEQIFDLRGEYQQEILAFPVSFTLRARSASSPSGGSNGGIIGTIGTWWSPVDLLRTRFSFGFGSVSGDLGQGQVVVLPGFSAEFSITPEHRFFGAFAPAVELRDLTSLVRGTPYLSASVPVRHTLVRNKGTFGIHSDWNGWLRSTIELETSRSSDYPVAADSGKGGFFTLFYGDVRETLVRGSVVAKLPANHYFSAIAIIRSSKYSASGLSVPYLPGSEVRLSYRKSVTERVDVEGAVQFVSAREAAVQAPSVSLPAYVRADARLTYAALGGLKVWADVRNLLGSSIEHWSGYREAPFGLNIGLSYAM